MSYSQYDEEQFILNSTPKEGRFLDIGAYHPTELSNTRALYERGWSGVMVEPSPGPFMTLLKEYGKDSRITLVQAAVGAEHSVVKLHATNGPVSTTSEASFKKWEQEGQFYGEFYVPQLTIIDLLDQFGAFQFVNIDAEGPSVDILFQLLSTPSMPFCICVEHNDRNYEIAHVAEAKGYFIAHLNPTNMVLARREDK